MLYAVLDFENNTTNLDGGDPFDTIVEEDGTVNVDRGATNGYLGTAGMCVEWSGGLTGLVGYGQLSLTNKGAPEVSEVLGNRPTHMRIRFDLSATDVSGFTTGNELKVLRGMYDLNGTATELWSISWVKTANNFKWKITESLGSTSVSGSNFAPTTFSYATFFSWNVDIIQGGNVAFIQISPVWDWTIAEQTAGAKVKLPFPTTVARIPLMTRIDIGVISGNIAHPSAASMFAWDNIRIEDDLLKNPGALFRLGKTDPAEILNRALRDKDHASCLPLDNAQMRLGMRFYSELGTVGDTLINTVADYTYPNSQIPIVPGFLYEVSATFYEHPDNVYDDGRGPKVGRGYTQIQPHEHRAEETAWESPPYWGMFQTVGRSHYFVPLAGQNSCLFYNAEWSTAEFYVRRLRFFE